MANAWKDLTMDKAKTIEWVKLIDCDYESRVKVWLRLIQKKYYEMEFEKKSRTWGAGFWFENMKMFAQYLSQVWK